MNRNEYRRAFIMLRPALAGWQGHARLERRVMTGSLYFIVTAPAQRGPAAACLAGQRGSETYAASLGALKPDSRGQLTLACTFDPRNIDGRPLEAYQKLVVADLGGCRVALTGNVDGAWPMDEARLRDAVCALYREDAPAADLPEPGEVLPPPMKETEPAAPPAEDAPPIQEAPPAEEEILAEEEETTVDPEPSDPSPGSTRIFTRMAAGAASVPSAEETEPQPEPTHWRAEASVDRSSPCGLPLADGYTYLRAPLPAACGCGYCLLGVKLEGDRVSAARVAVPGAYADRPPEGLEGSVWVGVGSGAGYWVNEVRCPDAPEE